VPDTPDQVAAYLAEVRRDLTDGAAYPRRLMELHGPRLLAAVEAALKLTRDTDGNDLPGGCEVPVGEFQAAIWWALLGEEAGGGH
jgi:hypothetical protein